jgi:hypothetical protein
LAQAVVVQQEMLITIMQILGQLVVIQFFQQLHLLVEVLVQPHLILLLVELVVLAAAVESVQVEA